MQDQEFSARLTQLRLGKNVSSREMSLALGQAPGYINNIENGRALPSMAMFFHICEYLDITPTDFFDLGSEVPARLRDLQPLLKRLSGQQLDHIAALLRDILER